MAMEGSGKLHCCSIVLFFLCGLVNTLQSVVSETKISTICNNTNNSWAMLSCSSDSWYHVIQELFSPVNNNCSLSIISNNLQENSETGLSVSCAGPASPPNTSVCSESVRRGVKDYNEALVEVTYECIPESKIYKLCFKQEGMLEGQVYLASPFMFASFEKSLFTNCSCEITGVLKAEVLYADVDNSNVNITCGNWSRTEFLFQALAVNTDLGFPNKACTMRIIYRDDNRSGSTLKGRVWMKVSGSNMMLNCDGQPSDVVVGSTTTVSTTLSTEDTSTMSFSSSSFQTPVAKTCFYLPKTSLSSSSSPSSLSPHLLKLLTTSSHLIIDIIATVLSVVGLWHLVDDKIAKVKLATRYILFYFWYGLQHFLSLYGRTMTVTYSSMDDL